MYYSSSSSTALTLEDTHLDTIESLEEQPLTYTVPTEDMTPVIAANIGAPRAQVNSLDRDYGAKKPRRQTLDSPHSFGRNP